MSLYMGIYLRALAALYLLGAAAHASNILSLSGRTWSQTPMQWRVLDVTYLVLDLAVALGLAIRQPWGVVLFLLAAISQLVLYLGLPGAFSETQRDLTNLRMLVLLHLITLAVYFTLYFLSGRRWV